MAYIETDRHKFEIVDYIPRGYKIWNIPTEDMNGYLPLYQDHPTKEHYVNSETLMAIKTDGVKELVRSASCGARTKKDMMKKIAQLEKRKKTLSNQRDLELIRAALVYAEQLIWKE